MNGDNRSDKKGHESDDNGRTRSRSRGSDQDDDDDDVHDDLAMRLRVALSESSALRRRGMAVDYCPGCGLLKYAGEFSPGQ